MTNPRISNDRQRELIAALAQLSAERVREEEAIRQRDLNRRRDARAEIDRERTAAEQHFTAAHGGQVREFHQSREDVYVKYEREGCEPAVEEARLTETELQRHAERVEELKNLRHQRIGKIQGEFREKQVLPKRELTQYQQQTDYALGEVHALVVQAQTAVRKRCPWPEAQDQTATAPPNLARPEYETQARAAVGVMHQKLFEVNREPIARFLEDGWPALIFLFGLLLLAYPFWLLLREHGLAAAAAATVLTSGVLALLVRGILQPLARRATQRLVPQFQDAAATARGCYAAALQAAHHEAEAKQKALEKKRDDDLEALKNEYRKKKAEGETKHLRKLSDIAANAVAKRCGIEDKYELEIDRIEATYPPRIAEIERVFEQQQVALSATFAAKIQAADEALVRERRELAERWTAALADFDREIGAMNAYCDALYPPWSAGNVETPAVGTTGVAALRFGSNDVDLNSLGVALADGDSNRLPESGLTLPAVLSYPECPSLLLKAEDDGREVAARVMQNVMLRLLTTLPPGKVRFTIIDPVGLGQNFSAFMHLADYEERLVTNRIWTEAAHIHQRLSDLTEHMENVIQKYLRNEFASIQEYNEHAGEVAEAFHILVIADFPAGFSDEAVRRLVSIAGSGAKCGVYTLISNDTRLSPPRNFDPADLEKNAAVLVWNPTLKEFRRQDETLGRLPLRLEAPPNDDQVTEIIRTVGAKAKDASRVEVPFEIVVPPPEQYWKSDSRGGIDVPLGRSGAKSLQYMRLGKGTSQHVLISGKTGSGKSTLLNSVITNLALYYSPDELEFYLIDFKKGVEFKAYATCRLPHARVIAIESEREFGMSVLDRLDQELKRRGDLFRKHGVQDVKGYRNAVPDAVMPRILLIIDEFQEFFTSDDRVSHDAALLLDRLVRQGRAFGIHLILGSQTLAGAYSLARSTIGQMAVRIALQCSESDAHLILSEDNTAARLLSRPGEAIYNDANGLFEGNHPFQVVWLSDEQRENYLERSARLAEERQTHVPQPIVFEGNAAADPAENRLLRELFHGPVTPTSSPAAYLGAAVAVKDPTSVTFRRQGGANLVVVGQQEELALGMLTNACLALAGHLPPRAADEGEPRFVILDGTRPDAPEAGFWSQLVRRTGLDAKVVLPRDSAAAIATVAKEVERRLSAGDAGAEPLFLVVHNLPRFRDLKKSDDYAMSFDDDDKPSANAGKQLATILREGPANGVHTLVWCDSYNNLSRWLDRQALRDFELRVLFQMSATDSSNLMDSPAASKLGPHMTLLYTEEAGAAEKLRPYGLPSREWQDWIATRLAERAGAPRAVASES